jgi:hypothetical protein
MAPGCARRFKQHVDMLIAFSERQHRAILQHLRKERWGRNAAQHGRRSGERQAQQGPTQAEQALASVARVPSSLPIPPLAAKAATACVLHAL